MAKRPEPDPLVLEALFSRQLCREGARDRAVGVPGLDRTSVSRRTPVREDQDVASFVGGNLGVEPCKISLVCLVMRAGVPVEDFEEVVEVDADGRLALSRDGGE